MVPALLTVFLLLAAPWGTAPTQGTPPQERDLAFGGAQAALQIHKTLHLLIEVRTTRVDGSQSHMLKELWLDLDGEWLRLERRRPNRPEPHSVLVADRGGITLYFADLDEYARDELALDLEAMLRRGRAGGLVLSALRGRLDDPQRRVSYGKPALVEEGAEAAGVACRRYAIPGNRTATVWIAEDGLPRQLDSWTGNHPRYQRQEERVLQIAVDGTWPANHFQLPGAPRKLPRTSEVRWPAQPDDGAWPRPGSQAPPLRAHTPGGDEVELEDLRGSPVVVAFWFSEHEPIPAALAEVERLLAADRAGYRLAAVHSGSDARAALESARRFDLKWELWLAGDGPDHSFAGWGIRGCPAFFVIDAEGRIVIGTQDPEQVKRALR